MKIILTVLTIIFCSAAMFPEKVAILPELGKPHAMESDGENIYIVDEATVHIYSVKDFKHIGSFGNRGDGPMELVPGRSTPIQLLLLNDKIVLSSKEKMVIYTKVGKPIYEKVFHGQYSEITPFNKNYAAVIHDVDDKDPLIHIHKVLLIAPDFKSKKTLISFESPPLGNRHGLGFGLPLFPYLSVTDNNLYVFSLLHDKEFFIFNAEGKQIKTLKVDLPKIKVTEPIKNDVVDYLLKSRLFKNYGLKEENLKETVFLPDYLPSVRLFKIKDGIIYIQTFEKKGETYRFVLMDLKGKILKSLFLPVDTYDLVQTGVHSTFCFVKNAYYYLVDNIDSENWELHKVTFTLDQHK